MNLPLVDTKGSLTLPLHHWHIFLFFTSFPYPFPTSSRVYDLHFIFWRHRTNNFSNLIFFASTLIFIGWFQPWIFHDIIYIDSLFFTSLKATTIVGYWSDSMRLTHISSILFCSSSYLSLGPPHIAFSCSPFGALWLPKVVDWNFSINGLLKKL